MAADTRFDLTSALAFGLRSENTLAGGFALHGTGSSGRSGYIGGTDAAVYGESTNGLIGALGHTQAGVYAVGTNPVTRAFYSTHAFAAGAGNLIECTNALLPGSDLVELNIPSTSQATAQFLELQWDTNDTKFRVNADGNVFADGSYTGPADFAEMIRVSSGAATVEAGDVLVIDPNNPRSVVKSTTAHSTLVAGIFSTEPGFVGSERDWDEEVDGESSALTLNDMAARFGEIPMAVVGIVPCKVTAKNGPIRPGDLLVTSSTPGHAMRADDPKTGTVIGKALGSLDRGLGVIRVLVTLQ